MEDFTLLKVIGKGSYGKVLLVKRIGTDEVLAMKILKKQNIARMSLIEYMRDEHSFIEKMRHPFIVKLRYAFQNTRKLYLVLEYCPGGELFFHLSRAGRFEESRAIFYAACIVLALEHLHHADIIYRDLKPENVLIDSQGYAKITDFGLSKENIMNEGRYRTFIGTLEYVAPEVLARQGRGKAVDWWSLGTLIFEMITGLPPFHDARDRERMFQDIMQSEVNIPAYVSDTAKSLLQGLFIKDPATRLGGGPRDAEEVKEHPWFASINWSRLLAREVPPQEVPPPVPALEEVGNMENVEWVSLPYADTAASDKRFDDSSLTY